MVSPSNRMHKGTLISTFQHPLSHTKYSIYEHCEFLMASTPTTRVEAACEIKDTVGLEISVDDVFGVEVAASKRTWKGE